MTPAITHKLDPKLDPKLDLVLERVVDVPPNLVWAAWTTPKYVKKWRGSNSGAQASLPELYM